MAVAENEAEWELPYSPFYGVKCVMGKSTDGSFNRENAAIGQTILTAKRNAPLDQRFGKTGKP
jgi:hypothetical protein